MKKALIILLTFTTIISLISCSKKEQTASEEAPQISGIELTEVKPATIDDIYEVSGTIRARTITTLSSRIMGEVTGIYAIEGDRVKQGQLLLTIDDRDYRERLAQAEEAYQEALKALESARQNKKLADITYERYKKLYDEKALTQQELDQIETQKEVAGLELQRMEAMVRRVKASLEEARLLYGYTRVVSPINGIITEKKVETGNMVMPGTPLFTVEDSENYRLEVYLDERFSGKIRKGMKVPVYIEARAEALEGRIAEIVPAVDPLTRSFLVKIDLNSKKDLRTGLYGRARFLTGKKTGILIPESSIVKRGQLIGTYVVANNGVIFYRIVRTGTTYPEKGMVEVLSGLNPGERIVTGGIEKVVEGGIYKK